MKLTGLWNNRDFLKLWTGQSISQFGSQITFVALPLTAVVFLEATPVQVGILTAVGALPPLVSGLLIGAWVDRRRKRPVMIFADWGRAALLITVPIAAWLDLLGMGQLILIAAGLGMLSLMFDVSYRSFLPVLVERDQLVEGNSKLEISRSSAEILAPGIGGTLVQVFTAPAALLVDAITFVASAISLSFIRKEEPEVAKEEQTSIWCEAIDGVKVVINDPILRPIAGCTATVGLFNAMLEAIYILYMDRHLELSPALIGALFSTGGIGLLLGALGAGRITGWIGLGPAIALGITLAVTSDLILPLAGGPLIVVIGLLVTAQISFGFGSTLYGIGQNSLRQAITPVHLQGRMNATMRVSSAGAIPLGALAGGFLGEAIGLRQTLFLAVIGEILAVTWLVVSPVFSVRSQPDPTS